MYKNSRAAIGLSICAGVLLAAQAQAQTDLYHVTVDTSSLVGNPNAPFYVDFQLNYGSGPFYNNATISNFNFGGGSASAPGNAIIYNGTGSTGDLNSAFTMSESASSPYNEIAQMFTPGQSLSFDVSLTANGTILTPDAFLFGIDDGSTFQIPTTSPDGITLAAFQINPFFSGPNPAISVSTYSGMGDYAGINVSVTPVPEPGYGSYAAVVGVLALAGRRARQAWRKS